jgi:hypothetical protein
VVWQADFGSPFGGQRHRLGGGAPLFGEMCNLDSLTTNQAAIITFEWLATPAPDAPAEFDLSHASRL